ncbi:MAG: leucine-rich repeat protein [bacterium]
MMKINAFIFLVFLLSLIIAGCGEKDIEDAFIIDEEQHAIIGYDISYGDKVEIPTTVKEIDITTICEGAFMELGITSVVIPDSILRIEDNAFYGNKISNLTLPATLQFLGSNSFANNLIKTLEFSDLYEIGYLPFEGNPLNTINFTGTDVFNTYNRIGFSLANTSVQLIEFEGFTFAWEYSTIVNYDPIYGLDVVIPRNIPVPGIGDIRVTDIGYYAFNNLGINSIALSDTLFSIGGYAFSNNNISTLIIPTNPDNNSMYFHRGAFMNNNLSELDVSIPFEASKDLFKGNSLYDITVNGELGYYAMYYEFMGLITENSFDTEYEFSNSFELVDYYPPYILPVFILNDQVYYIYMEKDFNSTNTSQIIDIYKLDNNELIQIQHFIIEDYSYGYVDSLVLYDGRILLLAYQIPLNADSNTYLPGTVIEFVPDFSSYTVNVLDNVGMRIPRAFTVNESGKIGIIGEGESYEKSSFALFDTSYQKIAQYYCDDYPGCSYDKIEYRDEEFIITGTFQNLGSCVNSICRDELIHVYDESGIIYSTTFEIPGYVETAQLDILEDNSIVMIGVGDYNTIYFRKISASYEIIFENEFYIHDAMISRFSFVIDSYYSFLAYTSVGGESYGAILLFSEDFDFSGVVPMVSEMVDQNLHFLNFGENIVVINDRDPQTLFIVTRLE